MRLGAVRPPTPIGVFSMEQSSEYGRQLAYVQRIKDGGTPLENAKYGAVYGPDSGEAIFEKYPLNAVENLFSPEKAAVLKEIKTKFFTQIRDAVMSVGPKNADGTDSELYKMSPIFKHFGDRGIVKLDYNEGDRIFAKEAAHAGSFMRPERIKNRKLGQIYRLQTASSADSISAGLCAIRLGIWEQRSLSTLPQ